MRPLLHALATLFLVAPAFAADKKPDILIILADDMGYGDMGITGSERIKTPHLDRLAASGVLCTQAYVSSPVCSPSRAGLITGRDPRRFGYEGNLNMGPDKYPTRPEFLGLPPGEHTLGDHLKAAGYRTGIIGKWHLGMGEGFHPNVRGFDYFCGMLSGSHNYFPTPDKHSLERNGARLTKFSNPYLTDFFTDEALEWMENGGDKPWFLFLSYNAPHTPMQATEEDLTLYAHIKDKKRRTYAAMMHALDRSVGRILDALKARDRANDTLIVFFSDNGGATSNASWNGPLSGAKGSLLEGGVRIPMIWSMPGTIPAGKRHDAPVSSLDLLPTFMAAAGSDPLPLADPRPYEDKKNRQRAAKQYGAYDGHNLLPVLSDPKAAKTRTLFWRLQGQRAVLHGKDKLISLSHRPPQLFRPSTDPGEQNDLALSETEALKSMFQRLGEWESNLPTVPLWGSSPYWNKSSAQIYDTWSPKPEPE